jgi:hypothetical protein
MMIVANLEVMAAILSGPICPVAEPSRPAWIFFQRKARMAKPDPRRALKFIAFAIFVLIVIGLMLHHSLHRP